MHICRIQIKQGMINKQMAITEEIIHWRKKYNLKGSDLVNGIFRKDKMSACFQQFQIEKKAQAPFMKLLKKYLNFDVQFYFIEHKSSKVRPTRKSFQCKNKATTQSERNFLPR